MSNTSTLLLQVVVLKTRIHSEEDVQQLAEVLENADNILKWTVDRQDSDKVLRVETFNTTTNEIMDLLGNNQIFCEELPD